MLNKAASSTNFWVFGMTGSEIEPRSPRPLVNTILRLKTDFCVESCLRRKCWRTTHTHTHTRAYIYTYNGQRALLAENYLGVRSSLSALDTHACATSKLGGSYMIPWFTSMIQYKVIFLGGVPACNLMFSLE